MLYYTILYYTILYYTIMPGRSDGAETLPVLLPRDHTNHHHPHLQTFSKFEVPNYTTNEHIKTVDKP